ncbi:unnamed protein product, partial [Ectocarpus sp. 12 AP-2014]
IIKQLQLASSSICGDCCELTEFHVNVNSWTPRRLWTASRDARGQQRSRKAAGVPGVPPVLVRQLTLGECFNPTVTGMRWPERLREIAFGKQFDNSLSGVEWPRTLAHVHFGCSFDHPLVRVEFPEGLESLAFGCGFNQPLAGVKLPRGL